ncbi:hypothetical protein [Parasedimentitalea psychrophila]|uniref:DUF1127 domain-containing protein n=1 Tax=Parasedimentitalea psychrophila TaxID=2997337 RepID=A0A9Y2L2F6_9RHOB|nr:hypothetical protein [Parasedimentitalea psychrophila]WIY26137.1 hypothetical protein QPJ95_04200 [Parasedimentitalea psychrophila]
MLHVLHTPVAIAATTQTVSIRSPFAVLKRGLSAIFMGLINVVEANPRYRQIQQLQALSDEQLVRKGLRRDDIVMHVFGHWM